MRAEIWKENNTVYKKIPASEYTFRVIEKELEGYRSWLKDADIDSPTTKVHFNNGFVIFEQAVVKDQPFDNPKIIVQKLSRLKFDKYGMDSNPNNFLGDNQLDFVDFFPLLVRDERLLDEEFDYGHGEALERYFKLGNVLSFYSIRLFKHNTEQALGSLQEAKHVLLREYQDIHPREKIRLLLALRLNEQGKMDEYSRAYRVTRYAKSISEDHDHELKQRLEKI